jgi:hypothetical protein
MNWLILIFMLASAIPGQSRGALVERYGKPVSETFTVRPGVSLTASYGDNGSPCAFLIEPTAEYFGADTLDEDTKHLSTDVVRSIFDELVPKDARGALESTGSFGRTFWEYENVTVFFSGRDNHWRRAVILFNGTGCNAVAEPKHETGTKMDGDGLHQEAADRVGAR